MFHLDPLEERGALLGEPYTRQLSGKLRELRFYCGEQRVRISYRIAPGRRIIALTVFTKTKMRESAEIERAKQAMAQLAERAGMTQPGIARFEAGGTTPTLPLLECLGGALGLTPTVSLAPACRRLACLSAAIATLTAVLAIVLQFASASAVRGGRGGDG